MTVATITIQNYFRMYEKLAGMTGTAATEAAEFHEIYGLEVGADPDQRRGRPPRRERPHLQDRRGEVRGRRGRYRGAQRDRPAGAGRHHLGGGVRVPLQAADAPRRRARGAERKEPRARGPHRRAGRAAGRGHDRHQHGRPRRRHQARRGRGRSRRPVRARHRAPRVAAHRQPAARPFRAPGRPRRDPLLPVGAGRGDPPVRRRPHLLDPRQAGPVRRSADRARHAHQADRVCPEEGRGVPLRQPQERRQVRRRAERAAQAGLRAPAGDPARRGHPRQRAGVAVGRDRGSRRRPRRRRLCRGVGLGRHVGVAGLRLSDPDPAGRVRGCRPRLATS